MRRPGLVMNVVQRLGSGHRAAFRLRATGLVLLAAHLLLVGWLTLRPLPVPWVTPANLSPLTTIRAASAAGLGPAVRTLGGSLLLLAPLGVLLPMARGGVSGPRLTSLTRTVATGVLVSAVIALLQTNVPGRTFDVDVVLLNAAGVGLVHLVLLPAVRAGFHRRVHGVSVAREDGTQGSTPTIPRVGIAP